MPRHAPYLAPVEPGGEPAVGCIGKPGAQRITEALKAFVHEHGGDPIAVRNFLYGKFAVERFSELRPDQEKLIMEHFQKGPNEPTDTEL